MSNKKFIAIFSNGSSNFKCQKRFKVLKSKRKIFIYDFFYLFNLKKQKNTFKQTSRSLNLYNKKYVK